MRRATQRSSVPAAVALVAAFAWGCSDGVEPQSDDFLSLFPDDPQHPWVLCDVFETRATVFGDAVGGEALTLTLPRGHRLDIPATALQQGSTVRITFRQLRTAAVAVELLPHDQQFADSVTLTLAYDGRGCQIQDTASLAIYRALPQPPHQLLTRAPTVEGRVVGRTDHFTTFAIAH